MENILKLVRTKQEAVELGTLVESAIAALFKIGQGNIDQVLKGDNLFGKVLASALPSDRNPQTTEKLLKDLQTALQTLKTINITIAIEPSEDLLDKMSDWANKNISQKSIFDVKVDPHIVGGAQVTINGKYTDSSLLKRLNKYFDASGQKLFKSLNI